MMTNIAKTVKSLIFVLALTSIAACNKSDELDEIFLDPNWKLTYIQESGIRRWPSQGNEYSLKFTDSGFSVTTPNGGSIKGRWHADGKTREFRCSDIRTSSISVNDTIARKMLQLLQEAKSYNGDIHFLQIIKDKDQLMQFYNK